MLLGEHAVVYGYPCLVTAVDKRLYVEASFTKSKTDEIVAPEVKESRFVLESISSFKEIFGINQAVKIITKGDFSHNVGLGSSSAVTVATFSALSSLFSKKLTLRQIFDYSYRITVKIQGVGSGFDIAAATFGRTVYFVKGGKTIAPVPTDTLPLIVGYSGVKADTPFYVRKVQENFKKRSTEMEQIFIKIGQLVISAQRAIKNGNYRLLGELMTQNHHCLQDLGVSTPKLDNMVNAATTYGGFGAKLSGAGGGDCMIAIAPLNRISEVENAIRNAGGEIIPVRNNASGVRQEKTI